MKLKIPLSIALLVLSSRVAYPMLSSYTTGDERFMTTAISCIKDNSTIGLRSLFIANKANSSQLSNLIITALQENRLEIAQSLVGYLSHLPPTDQPSPSSITQIAITALHKNCSQIAQVVTSLGNDNDRKEKQHIFNAAVETGNTETVRLLIGQCDVNISDAWSPSLLHTATKKRYKTIAELLISHGANVATEYNGLTPLAQAINNRMTKVIKLLILKDSTRVRTLTLLPTNYIMAVLINNPFATSIQSNPVYQNARIYMELVEDLEKDTQIRPFIDDISQIDLSEAAIDAYRELIYEALSNPTQATIEKALQMNCFKLASKLIRSLGLSLDEERELAQLAKQKYKLHNNTNAQFLGRLLRNRIGTMGPELGISKHGIINAYCTQEHALTNDIVDTIRKYISK
ncbi:ankyrin repeat domain-containing protein [Candidatus Dependentiae bacterium]|nr:ankyrin repeat domain-containing protein [Candidatus Dependentiae bacterium]